jgi:hypothetical protein
MSQEDKITMFGEGAYIGIWLSGWGTKDERQVYMDSVWLENAPSGVNLSSRIGQEDFYLYPNKERISLYVAIEKEYAEAYDMEEVLQNLKAGGIATRKSDNLITERFEVTIDFSQVRQREFHKEANVTAKIESCERTDLNTIGIHHPYIGAAERNHPGKVSYWEIAVKIESDIPIYNLQANEQSEELDITYFEDEAIVQDLTTTVIIPYDEIEPTYDDVVRMLKEAKLSCSFSPEPRMLSVVSYLSWGEFGPYYCVPFDLTALEK